MIGASGLGAGPATTCALCAGSNSAPWHGHTRRRCPESQLTGQPAWVQTVSNATMLPPASSMAIAGSPLAGS